MHFISDKKGLLKQFQIEMFELNYLIDTKTTANINLFVYVHSILSCHETPKCLN